MDDLASLFSALQATQQAKVNVKLSERNIIELINKLKLLGVIGDEVLHTINGKEYITKQQLKKEIKDALEQAGGRLSIVELPALLGTDLIHCERQAAALVSESGGSIIEAQGELLSTQYFESISAEINDVLQESGQLSLAELALQYQLASELTTNIINSNLGTRIQGRLDSGLLYTPAALRRVKAQLRGALRASVQPCAVTSVAKEIGLDGFGASTVVLNSIMEELVRSRAVCGVLKAGGGLSWTPSLYASAQQSALTTFYEQNGWLGYDMAKKLGYGGDAASLTKVFPQGIPLETAFINPSLLVSVQASIEEALTGGTWVDVSPLLPSAFTPGDITQLLEHVPQLKKSTAGTGATGKAGKGNNNAAAAAAAAGGNADASTEPVIVGATCVLSAALLTAVTQEVVKLAREGAEKALKEKKVTPGNANVGSRGGSQQSLAKAAKDDDDDDDDWGTGKKGKGGKGGKAGKGKAGGGASANKGSSKASNAQQCSGNASTSACGVDIDQISDMLVTLYPDMEGCGEDGALVPDLAALLHPKAVSAWEAALVAAFTAGAESRRQAKDSLAKAVEDAFTKLCLYCSGLELFAVSLSSQDASDEQNEAQASGKEGKKGGKSKKQDKEAAAEGGDSEEAAVYQAMEKHVIRTAGGELVDFMYKWVSVEVQAAQADGNATAVLPDVASPPLSAAERLAIIKESPADMATALQAASQAVTVSGTTKAASTVFEESASQLGLWVKRPDKKNEKSAVASVRATLMGQLASERDPAAALALLIPLLFIKATGCAILLPGRAITTALSKCVCKDVSKESLEGVHAFHSKVVEYLKSQSAGGNATLLEELTAALPGLKALVGLGDAAE